MDLKLGKRIMHKKKIIKIKKVTIKMFAVISCEDLGLPPPVKGTLKKIKNITTIRIKIKIIMG
jgi:hypothetical protein